MDNIVYQYNKYCNKSENEERFTNWKDYREWVNGVVNRSCEINNTLKQGTLAILGAGNCDDIDLGKLSQIFNSIYLFDIDEEALKRGIKKYTLNDKCIIHMVTHIEFTGIGNTGFFEHIDKLIKDNRDIEKINQYIVNNLDCNNLVETGYEDMFDMVISMPVYTQMGGTLIGNMLNKHIKNQFHVADMCEKLKFGVQKIDEAVLNVYNNYIMNLCKKSGRILVISDIAEFSIVEFGKLKSIIPYIKSGNSQKIMSLIQDNMVSGAFTGFSNLMNRLINLNDIYMYYWIWPFSDIKNYVVMGQSVDKKNCY